MSDHPREARRHLEELEELNICDDIWLDTLVLIGRAEVATKFALINARFNAVVDIHLRHRKWTLGTLYIQRARRGTGAEIVQQNDGTSSNFLPVANSPLPPHVNGFEAIHVCYIDRQVLTFLRHIRRMLSSNISLQFSIRATEQRCWNIMAQEIWPLMANGISALMDMRKSDFDLLHKYISPNVLADCVSLRRIFSHYLPTAPLNTLSDLRPGQDQYTWLQTPRHDGLPKLLSFYRWRKGWPQLTEQLTKNFFDANSTPVSFLIYSCVTNGRVVAFNVVNDRTQERLAQTARAGFALFWHIRRFNVVLWRCPVQFQFNPTRVSAWEEEANELKNFVYFTLRDADIGPSL
ncbi:hypothetical protein GPALN_011658 [Globodera pallida]|nr:hypothetical protein GPALN_011658 [Globodera pallida]